MGRIFWLDRLKRSENDSSWAVPYGDLMSLLLAVFVMIAAMSELRADEQFRAVRQAVRSAFGFGPGSGGDYERSDSLWSRLTEAGLNIPPEGATHEPAPLAACEVVRRGGEVVVVIPGGLAFDVSSARLLAEGQTLVRQLARYLSGGKTVVEVRGFAAESPVPDGAERRDPIDLAYARVRAVMDGLSAGGVASERLRATACGERREDGPDADLNRARDVEIVVHALPAARGDERTGRENG
jgi:flagellar motor protein MotB